MELQRMLQFSYHLQYFMQPNILSKIPDIYYIFQQNTYQMLFVMKIFSVSPQCGHFMHTLQLSFLYFASKLRRYLKQK